MAKHQERVIVDVRNIFPSAGNSLASVQADNTETNYASSNTSSHIHETPSTIERNTNSNFIFGNGDGSHDKDLGFYPQRNTKLNQNTRHLPRVSAEDDDDDESVLDTPFDVTAFMTSYMSSGSNKRNPLFGVENEETANSNVTNFTSNTNGNLQTTDPQLGARSSGKIAPYTERENNTGISNKKKMDTSGDKHHTGNHGIAHNQYNESNHIHDADTVMEEEVSMEFWEEEAEDKVPKLYTEYVGEDFSQYLDDDVTKDENEQDSKTRDGKNKTPHGTNLLEISTTGGSVNSLASVTSDKKISPGIKTKFPRVFHFNSLNGKSKPNYTDGQNSIHKFSYSNSKIGTTRGQSNKERLPQYFDSLSTNDIQRPNNESDSFLCTNPNDIDAMHEGQMSRTAEGNSDVILRSRQPSTSSSGGSMNSGSLLNDEDRKLEDFLRDGNLIEPDFESKRKRNLYDSKGKQQSKKHSNFFKIRLHRKSSPEIDGDVMDVVQNTVFNPLSDSSDVYL